MKLKNIKAKEIIRILQREGFQIKRQTGSHLIMKKDNLTVVVPDHKTIIPIGTLKSIERQSKINLREIIG